MRIIRWMSCTPSASKRGSCDVGVEQTGADLDRLRHVRQPCRFGHPVGDVDAEAVHPTVQPEPQGPFEIGGYLRVVPVEVWLLGREQVQVPLRIVDRGAAGSMPGRRRCDSPVVRRPATRSNRAARKT